MQRIALQCREEAVILRSTNDELTRKVAQLEAQLSALRSAGCRAPRHEAEPVATSSGPANTAASPGAGSAWQAGPSAQAHSPPKQSPNDEANKTLLPKWPSEPDSDEADIDCGFCTDAETCACRGKATLGFGEVTPIEPPEPAVALPRRPFHGSAVPLRRAPNRGAVRLWATHAPQVLLRRPAASRAKLWAAAPEGLDPQCSGNPRNCRACGTDPDLQEFCSAIARHSGDTRPSTIGDQSIPDAFTRIRSHPNYARFRGGLDLLADVVLRAPGESRQQVSSVRQDEPAPKRKRHENEDAVSAALELLDHPEHPTQGKAGHAERSDAQPCPCPWYNIPSRLPWPR